MDNGNLIFSDLPDVLEVADMQRALRVGRNVAYKLISENVVKHFRVGNRIKIPKVYLIQFMLEQ